MGGTKFNDVLLGCLSEEDRIGARQHQVMTVPEESLAAPVGKGDAAQILAGCKSGFLYFFKGRNKFIEIGRAHV